MTGKRCALITLDDDVEEIEELARSAGYEILFIVLQKRSRPDPVTFIGRGKLEEIGGVLKEVGIDALILNGDLKPSQHYLIENTLKVECVDRIRLVLDIFTLRANNKESRLQVERARLRYEVPLLREWIHSAKAGEHPGFLGSGEYAVDAYYDLIKMRMKRIDDELDSMRSTERQRREQRRRRGFHLVSFAGYTNAGKSSMMRSMTGEDVLVQDMMFSTLSTTTKRLKGSSSPILITDTIGFLDDLPPYVIEAFKNTIE
ncbi:MAG: GTPase HflX, partial [Methanomassiliicoccales archaeon]|nr:GTPase HflX [Methanomassiliicoccales archaeon]